LLYTSFFGLGEEPFGVTPDPKFLYVSHKHEEAIATLTYGITQNRGFIMLTGEVGSGKTTILRHVFDNLEPDVRTAMVLNPKMNPLELLKFINSDFGLPVKRNATHKSLMDDLNRFLLECHRSGDKAVLAIDEAQEMSAECLEFVRLLSNLETDTQKLIQIILVGQPELRDIVGGERLRQLDQRIAVRYHIEPLDAGETAHYISHRLKVAGSIAIDFPKRGVKAIHKFTRGVPRLINLACDRVLLASFAHEELRIRTGRIKEVLKEFKKEEVASAKETKTEKTKKEKQTGKKVHVLSLRPVLATLGILAALGLFLYGGLEEEHVTDPEYVAASTIKVSGESERGIFVEDGIYRAKGAALSEEASLMNLLKAWGEKGLDGIPIKDTLQSRGYAVYSFGDMEKLIEFSTPVVLKLEDSDSLRHVTLRWVVGGYAVILDPLEGKQMVPFSWVKDKAIEARLLYRKGGLTGDPDEKALLALLSKNASNPSLIP
jgi:general secretion pathway protein A